MISVYYNQKYGFLIVPNAIERFMGCYISIEPTIEIMAEETIDKIGCAIRKGIKIAESSPKVDESQLNNFWKQTKYKSFPTFSKNYQRIDLKQNGDELEIRRWERNNRGGYSRKTEEKDYINFIEMSDYELGLFIKKMFEPCEIRIDETERFETLEGKIISYSIPNEHYKNIGDGHTDDRTSFFYMRQKSICKILNGRKRRLWIDIRFLYHAFINIANINLINLLLIVLSIKRYIKRYYLNIVFLS